MARWKSAFELINNVTENINNGMELGHGLGVAIPVGLATTALGSLISEALQPQPIRTLEPDGRLNFDRGQTIFVGGDADTSTGVVFTGVGRTTDRLVLDSNRGERLVLNLHPGERIGVRLDPGESAIVHSSHLPWLRF